MENSKLAGKIQEEIEKLLNLSEDYIEKEVGVHAIEKGLLKQLLRLGLEILKCIICEKLKKTEGYVPNLSGDIEYENKGKKERKYLSLFGHLTIERPSYWNRELGDFQKLDEYLKLPIGIYWSYNIQELVGETSTETDYRESVRIMNSLLSLGLSGKSSERNVDRLGEYVECFYGSAVNENEEEGINFSAGFDGKGVPKIKPSKEIRDNPKERLQRGQKRGVKQMATVSVTSSFTPQQRTAESIIAGLMGKEEADKSEDGVRIEDENKTDNKLHKNIHRRGFLADQEGAIEYGIQEIKRRMSNPKSRFVVPIDAGIGLEEKVLSCVKKYKLKSKFDGIILDIVHVSEYVWDAATAIFGEKSKFRRGWVRVVSGVAHTLEKALGLFYTIEPDVAIVDIMIDKKADGVTFAEKINEHPLRKKPVIFLTGMREKNIFEQAKKTIPSSYLLKPFNLLELEFAIELAVEKFEKNHSSENEKSMSANPSIQEYIFIKKGNHLEKLSYSDINFIMVEKKYCELFTHQGKFVVQYSLKEMLTKLPSFFMQVHRNYIINTTHIIRFNVKESYLLMPNEKIIRVSKRQKEQLLELINKI